jgi:hypothetical protein
MQIYTVANTKLSDSELNIKAIDTLIQRAQQGSHCIHSDFRQKTVHCIPNVYVQKRQGKIVRSHKIVLVSTQRKKL